MHELEARVRALSGCDRAAVGSFEPVIRRKGHSAGLIVCTVGYFSLLQDRQW